jgi:hypothetical protein
VRHDAIRRNGSLDSIWYAFMQRQRIALLIVSNQRTSDHFARFEKFKHFPQQALILIFCYGFGASSLPAAVSAPFPFTGANFTTRVLTADPRTPDCSTGPLFLRPTHQVKRTPHMFLLVSFDQFDFCNEFLEMNWGCGRKTISHELAQPPHLSNQPLKSLAGLT